MWKFVVRVGKKTVFSVVLLETRKLGELAQKEKIPGVDTSVG